MTIRFKRIFQKVFLILLFFVMAFPAFGAQEPSISWTTWTADLFQKAKKENKFVLLDLEAVWCHWGHVMDETTYQNEKVVELIGSKYIAVRVDQDSNPELSNRYEDYGWPATIVFGPDGNEIVKRRGYIAPQIMASLLEAIIADPTPGPSVLPEQEIKPAESAFLKEEQKKLIEEDHLSLYDKENGGWGSIHKLIDSDQTELALLRAQAGNKQEEEMGKKTLDAALNLLDTEWGGFYQYSDEANWKSPHYEKIMSIQAQYIQIYGLAYGLFAKTEYLHAAEITGEYIKNFLMFEQGAFYTSQDADLDSKTLGHDYYSLKNDERRKLGMPRIDKHIYARENGWVISAFCVLYDVTHNREWLSGAEKAAKWILANRKLEAGGFSHGEEEPSILFLGDTLAMGRAFLALYASTGERSWLGEAETAAKFTEKNFKNEGSGFVTSFSRNGNSSKPVKNVDENIALARFFNLLSAYSGNADYKKSAEHIMLYLGSSDLLKSRHFLAGILLTDTELSGEPIHITIVGPKDDPNAAALHDAALGYPSRYKRVEWWDKREGPMPNPDVKYPELPKPAAFACASKTCSLPVFDPDKVVRQVERLMRREKAA